MHAYVFSYRSQKKTSFLGAGVPGACELPSVGAGSLTLVFSWSKCSWLLSHLSAHLGFSEYRITLPAWQVLFCLFIDIPFLSVSCSVTLVKMAGIYWTWLVRMDFLVLFLILEELLAVLPWAYGLLRHCGSVLTAMLTLPFISRSCAGNVHSWFYPASDSFLLDFAGEGSDCRSPGTCFPKIWFMW